MWEVAREDDACRRAEESEAQCDFVDELAWDPRWWLRTLEALRKTMAQVGRGVVENSTFGI